MNAFFLMMLADNDDNDNNSKMDKLIPLLMLQDPNSMQNQNLWNNPLFYMSMIDDEDQSSCDKKYNVNSKIQVEFDEKTGAFLANNIGEEWDQQQRGWNDAGRMPPEVERCICN